jgi:pimeloyl-ACP methyl ester carboxylesterase
MQFARAGFAGVSVDGPLGGLRNLEGWDEQFAIFNINNPPSLRDSIRQSALELALLAHTLPALSIDASACPGLSTSAGDGLVTLDTTSLALMGHSMGATIAPLTAAIEPAYRALILSGAGASWIENILYKLNPLDVRPLAEVLLGYTDRTLEAHDPALALLQWAGEPADPQVYARAIVAEPRVGAPRHVLMFQGILDTYIPPPIANALSLALEVDLGGPALDETLAQYAPLGPALDLAGAARVALPASGNRGDGAVTAFVVQHLEDGIEDGHEVVFQRAEPQRQYRCFLASLAQGVPRVVAAEAAACD